MENKDLKLTEKDYKILNQLGDKDAGKLIKYLCKYVFEGILEEPKDRYIKVYFYMMKGRVDEREWKKEIGRLGGLRTAELKRNAKDNQNEKTPDGKITIEEVFTNKECPLEDILNIFVQKAPQKTD